MGHPRKPHGVFAADPNEDYSEFGDDVHMNDALYYKGRRDLYEIFLAAGAISVTEFDVLYGAGIGNQGLTYYRDRSLDPAITVKINPDKWRGDLPDATQISATHASVSYDFLWWIHETDEWNNATILGRHKDILIGQIARKDPSTPYAVGPVSRIHYRVAHQEAEAAEERMVEAMGLDKADYVRVCDSILAQAGSQTLRSSPRDLDLYPYEDEVDMASLQQIADTGGPESYLLLDRGVTGGSSGRPFYE